MTHANKELKIKLIIQPYDLQKWESSSQIEQKQNEWDTKKHW